MSLVEIGRSQTYACKRIFYQDEEGRLVERLLHNSDEYEPVIQENQQDASDFRAHNGGSIRRVASIPCDIFIKMLKEEGIKAFCSEEAMDMVVNKKLKDPQYKYLLTVPETYRTMRYGN